MSDNFSAGADDGAKGLQDESIRRVSDTSIATLDALSAGREDAAGQLSDELKATASAVGEAARQHANLFVSDVGQEFSNTVDAQKARGADAIKEFARFVKSSAPVREAPRERSRYDAAQI